MTTETLRRTPLYDAHKALGGKMVPFAGYEMPVQYRSGITAEHNAVRNGCGIFDVSHMGEFEVTGPDRNAFVNRVTCNDVAALESGGVQYSAILTPTGTFVDDCTVYRFDDKVMIVVNASNRAKAWEHIVDQKGGINVRLRDISDDIGLLALQGPKAEALMQPLTDIQLPKLEYYHFTTGRVAGVDCFVSRTGYTGEDGFELYAPNESAVPLWNAIVGTGRVTPCGLGARDTLRLEMGMALYGNDIDDGTTPLEANLAWLVKMNKGEFVGREALVAQKERGLQRRLVGFTMAERNFPRHGYPVIYDGRRCGVVCSGTMSPTLGIPIGTCYLPLAAAKEGTAFEIEIRGKRVPATVTKPPFYKHASHL
jgi:aminomethyltransferase